MINFVRRPPSSAKVRIADGKYNRQRATAGRTNPEFQNTRLKIESRIAEIEAEILLLEEKPAKVFDKSKNAGEAGKYFTEGENLCRQNLIQDTNRTETIYEELESFNAIADYYFDIGKRVQSVSILTETVRKMEAILDKNEWDLQTAFALAKTFEKIGDFQTGKQSRDFYEKSDKIWTKYQQTYPLLPTETEKMEAVRKKLQSN